MASAKTRAKRVIKATVRELKPVKALAKRLAKDAAKAFSKGAKRAPSLMAKALAAAKKKLRSKVKPRKPLTPKQVLKEVALFNSMRVTVGIHDDKGGLPHKNGGGLSVAEIMAVHEFGSDAANIPKRSWLRDWFDAEREALRSVCRDLAKLVSTGKITAKVAGTRLGVLCVGGIQARIATGIPPELAPSTVARKRGSTKQLIDSGQGRSSVAFKLHFGPVKEGPTVKEAGP